MAEQSFPRDDVEYLATDMRLFHAGRSAGVINATGNDFYASPSGMTLTVQPGVAFLPAGTSEFGGLIYALKDATSFTLAAADNIQDRVDALVIRYNSQQNSVTLELVQGTKSSNPTRYLPVRDANTYELVLKYIYVRHGAGTISMSAITDCIRDENLCGISDTLNKIPTDQISAEFNTWWNELRASYEASKAEADVDFDAFQEYLIELRQQGDSDLMDVEVHFQGEMNTFKAQATTEIMEWFTGIQGQLSGDIAVDLAMRQDEQDRRWAEICQMIYTNCWQAPLATSEGDDLFASDGVGISTQWHYVEKEA